MADTKCENCGGPSCATCNGCAACKTCTCDANKQTGKQDDGKETM